MNFCGKLVSDPSVAVRVAFLDCLGWWLTELPERQDHECRLLQFLMAALNDEAPQVEARGGSVAWCRQLTEQWGAAGGLPPAPCFAAPRINLPRDGLPG